MTPAYIPGPPMAWPSIAHIQARVAVARRVPMIEMISCRRQRDVVHARQLAIYLAKQLTPRSLPQIGRRFHRDHTTVLHAIRQVEKRLAASEMAREEVARLSALLAPETVGADALVDGGGA